MNLSQLRKADEDIRRSCYISDKIKGEYAVPVEHASIYVGTSVVETAENGSFETAMPFYMMTEIPLFKYTIFKTELEYCLNAARII